MHEMGRKISKTVAWVFVSSSILAFLPGAAASEPVYLGALDVLSLQVNFHLEDSVAATHLALLVQNPANVSREASLSLPLSENAVLTSLTLTTHNRTLVGIVTEKGAASSAYNASKERNEDAVLLDSAGKGLLSLRLNAAPGATLRLDAVYAEIVPLELGIREYMFPASKIQDAFRDVGHFRVNATIKSSVPWSAIEAVGVSSPLTELNDRSATWVYDVEEHRISNDLVIRITPVLSEYASAMLLSGRQEHGVFTATILPPSLGNALPVDVIFVLDHSGSMSGEKMDQAKAALDIILGQLRSQDRFGIVVFDDDIEKYKTSLLAVSGGNIDAAQDWVGRVQAEGSTNIEGGLSAALAILGGQERAALPMIVLITDGLPTAGITSHRDIIESVDTKNTLGARVHVVGIGFDQDNAFLGELASSQRGFYRPIGPSQGVASELEDFYAQIASPILKDVSVEFVGLAAQDVHPAPFPDLYRGSELVVAARADTRTLPAVVKIILRGSSSTGEVRHEIAMDSASLSIRPEVEKLWARQKANTLERYIQLHQATSNVSSQQADLLAHGLRYQIETMRTSWVIVPVGELASPTADRFEDTRSAFDNAYGAPAAGAPPAAPPGAPPAAPPGAPPAATTPGGLPAAPDLPTTSRTPGFGLILAIIVVLGVAVLRTRVRRDV